MLVVTKAEYVSGYKLRVTFSDGKTGNADLHRVVHQDARGVFSELREIDWFRDFTVDLDTVCWGNGLDLAPEYLYFQAFRDDVALRDQFETWGYLRSEPVPGT